MFSGGCTDFLRKGGARSSQWVENLRQEGRGRYSGHGDDPSVRHSLDRADPEAGQGAG